MKAEVVFFKVAGHYFPDGWNVDVMVGAGAATLGVEEKGGSWGGWRNKIESQVSHHYGAIIAAWTAYLDFYKEEKYKYFVFLVTCSWTSTSIEVSWENRSEVRWNFYSFCHYFIIFIANQCLIEHCVKDDAGWPGVILKDGAGSGHHKQRSVVKKKSFKKIAPALLYKCSYMWSQP